MFLSLPYHRLTVRSNVNKIAEKIISTDAFTNETRKNAYVSAVVYNLILLKLNDIINQFFKQIIILNCNRYKLKITNMGVVECGILLILTAKPISTIDKNSMLMFTKDLWNQSNKLNLIRTRIVINFIIEIHFLPLQILFYSFEKLIFRERN